MKYLIAVVLIFCSGLALAQSPGSFRSKEIHGLGFGAEGPGAAIFYDYAINQTFQVHIFGTSLSKTITSVSSNNSIETAHTVIGATLRIFPSESSGLFVGLGFGGSSGTQAVTQSIYCSTISANPVECSGFEGTDIELKTESVYSAGSAWISAGWQGYDGYYFTIGFMAGADFGITEEDNTDQVIDTSNHKSTAQDEWKFAKSGPSGIIISFGWHL